MSVDEQLADPPWTILRTLKWTTGYFADHGIESPRADAEILLARTLGCQRIDLYLRHDQPLNADELSEFRALIRRRARREPVAYITGKKDFIFLYLYPIRTDIFRSGNPNTLSASSHRLS